MANGEKTYWIVSPYQALGPRNISVNVSGNYYDSDSSLVELVFYGWSNITNLTLSSWAYVGQIVDIQIKVVDSNNSMGTKE